jgi:selenide,water dikinase
VELDGNITEELLDILFDAQTSGGLLIAVPSGKAEALLDSLHQNGVEQAVIIGEIVDEPRGKIVVRE